MALSQPEWNRLNPAANFPKLVHAQCIKTGEETFDYNCICWFLQLPFNYQGQHFPVQWVDPPVGAAQRDQYLAAARLVPCDYEDFDRVARLYERHPTRYLHGDRWNTASGSWESKMGALVRMLHQESGLSDDGIFESFYGNPSFWCKRAPGAAAASVDPSTMSVEASDDQESIDRIAHFANSLDGSFPRTATVFDTLFAAWKGTWFTGRTNSVSQNSEDRASGAAWDALVAYTSRVNVLPQIVQKLSDPANVFAVHLYNAAQSDSSKKVNPRDTFNYYFLKNQVMRIQKLYGASIQEFTTQADEWVAHQANVSLSSNSSDYLNSPAYNRLVEMGTPIVALIMERYARERNGWWHELLHHIVNGRASGSVSFPKTGLFDDWKAQYEISAE
ncbi:hypothetical protein TWF703_009008 [Orbilia oligospora]|uniref:DUF7689 domain-containing protein n=1 Tax=Orbilia oligospora TaxID=2813651 RepID=A0A7C8JS70_ORBOL|nr:hypothetical protein TWF703_009008 [Orbilia oligospora]